MLQGIERLPVHFIREVSAMVNEMFAQVGAAYIGAVMILGLIVGIIL